MYLLSKITKTNFLINIYKNDVFYYGKPIGLRYIMIRLFFLFLNEECALAENLITLLQHYHRPRNICQFEFQIFVNCMFFVNRKQVCGASEYTYGPT